MVFSFKLKRPSCCHRFCRLFCVTPSFFYNCAFVCFICLFYLFCRKLWNALTGDEIASIAHPRIVKSVRFSNDDQFLLTGGQDKLLRLFDVKTNAQLFQLEGHSDSIKSAIFNQDDSLIFSCSADGVRYDIINSYNLYINFY